MTNLHIDTNACDLSRRSEYSDTLQTHWKIQMYHHESCNGFIWNESVIYALIYTRRSLIMQFDKGILMVFSDRLNYDVNVKAHMQAIHVFESCFE